MLGRDSWRRDPVDLELIILGCAWVSRSENGQSCELVDQACRHLTLTQCNMTDRWNKQGVVACDRPEQTEQIRPNHIKGMEKR